MERFEQELAAYVGAKGAPPTDMPPVEYLRCTGLDPASLSAYLAADSTSLSQDQFQSAFDNPFADGPAPEMQKIARDILAKIGQ